LTLTPLPRDYHPDFARWRTALLRQGEPDWVPWQDGVSDVHRQRILGRPLRGVADDIAFAKLFGFDYVTITSGLTTSDEMTGAMTTKADDTYDTVQRRWANEGEGAISSHAGFEAFDWPNPDEMDYSAYDEADRLLPSNMKVFAAVGKVFNAAWWLMGFESFSYALAEDPDLVARVFEKVCAIQERVVEHILDHTSVGTLWHADDLAYKSGLMVSPAIFRRFVFPLYAKVNRMCHERGVLCIFHSDGDINAVIGDIISAGFDGLNPLEPPIMDIVALKREVAGRLTLIGNIDLAYTLTLGTPTEVDAEVKERIRVLAPGGGYCLSSANSLPDYVPFNNIMAMRDAWLRYGRYPIRL
jgi:uroporphyrinogen decarboxylase